MKLFCQCFLVELKKEMERCNLLCLALILCTVISKLALPFSLHVSSAEPSVKANSLATFPARLIEL